MEWLDWLMKSGTLATVGWLAFELRVMKKLLQKAVAEEILIKERIVMLERRSHGKGA